VTEKELKFKEDVRGLVLRALRAGASPESIQMVMAVVMDEMDKSRPFIKAILEKDLGP
jgi:hypothetical protein